MHLIRLWAYLLVLSEIESAHSCQSIYPCPWPACTVWHRSVLDRSSLNPACCKCVCCSVPVCHSVCATMCLCVCHGQCQVCVCVCVSAAGAGISNYFRHLDCIIRLLSSPPPPPHFLSIDRLRLLRCACMMPGCLHACVYARMHDGSATW